MKRDEQIRMLLHPEEYTDEQMDRMLEENDITMPNAEEAWEQFRGRTTRVKRKRLLTKKAAAMFIGVLMLGSIAYATIQWWTAFPNSVKEGDVELHASASSSFNQVSPCSEEPQETVLVYENIELATILNDVATFYQCEVVFKEVDSKHIRLYFTWDKEQTIDNVIDTFNKFERIHITREDKKLIVD